MGRPYFNSLLKGYSPIDRDRLSPEELKDAVVYLASDACKYVTGIVLPVHGGHLAV
jgi:NAD(P)-dependent dehydrogenase (short-subunit alcohol dehydrogenase family)